MHLKIALALAALASPAAASSMPVSEFIARADALRAKGVLALFSGDYKRLTDQVKGDFAQLRSERLAAQAAQRPTAFCPPSRGIKLTDKDIMGAMHAVPAASRATTDTRDALRSFMSRRYPCRN